MALRPCRHRAAGALRLKGGVAVPLATVSGSGKSVSHEDPHCHLPAAFSWRQGGPVYGMPQNKVTIPAKGKFGQSIP